MARLPEFAQAWYLHRYDSVYLRIIGCQDLKQYLFSLTLQRFKHQTLSLHEKITKMLLTLTKHSMASYKINNERKTKKKQEIPSFQSWTVQVLWYCLLQYHQNFTFLYHINLRPCNTTFCNTNNNSLLFTIKI